MHTPPAFAWIRVLSVFLLVCLFSTFVPQSMIADALVQANQRNIEEELQANPGGGLSEIRNVNTVEERYGVVALLVEETLYRDAGIFAGGFGGGLTSVLSIGAGTLKEKIDRYAADIQNELPWTKVLIITVEKDDSTVEIQKLLERLYFEGNPNDNDKTQLSGVVMVGAVPIPVVNKNGNRFLSMLPYTDFEDPAYILEPTSQDFLRNAKAGDLQAEVWHGLLVPPLTGEAGEELLEKFFDKNHDFHTGDADYTTFDQKVFLGDLVTERNTLNNISFKSYDQFTRYWEEIAYYRTTNEMVESLYTEMVTEMEEGDVVDNDGDGTLDEEANNGVDDDGDGLIDEDLGDSYYGVDNDGDGAVDEDSLEDNNNDANRHLYEDNDLPFYEDHMIDEDPPGDANGDGCPGRCGVDDNGNSVDHDGDGYPSGWEITHDYEWNDQRKPHKRVSKKTNNEYGTNFDENSDAGDRAATRYLEELYSDEDYRDILPDDNNFANGHPGCFDGADYHGEWDDDEDGFCDEDGSTQIESGNCAFNDSDCDGLIDEDPIGFRPESLFAAVPDIQSKQVVNDMVSRYVDIFEQPQGVWNRLVGGTGRYKVQESDGESVSNDFDTAISLIAKKDELTLQYLRSVNDYFEGRVNEMAQTLDFKIPLVVGLQVTGEVTYEPEDEDSEPKKDEMCNKDSNNVEKGCVQFVNHSTMQQGTEFVKDLLPLNSFINGNYMPDIAGPKACSIFGGTFGDGQFVKYSGLYSRTLQEYQVENDPTRTEEEWYKGCLLKNSVFEDEDPDEEICFNVLATVDVSSEDGAVLFEDTDRYDIAGFETGYPACYEYRELDTFQIYSKVNGEFSDWLTKSLRKDDEDFEEYEDVVAAIEEKKDEIADNNDGNRPGEVTLRAGFDTLVIFHTDDPARDYTLQDLFDDAGMGDWSEDELDVFMTNNPNLIVNNPTGPNMGEVQSLKAEFKKYYISEEAIHFEELDRDLPYLTEERADSRKIPSIHYYTEPDTATLNAQIADGATRDLPIDENRRVTFMDADEETAELEYINVFDSTSVRNLSAQVTALKNQMAGVAGGEDFVNEIEDFLDEINVDQLEDSLDWYQMNIDEKHNYIFTHYLGEGEPIWAKARDGYEIMALIVDGEADELQFGFNALAPDSEEDAIFNYRSETLAAAALDAEDEPSHFGVIDEDVPDTIPVPLGDWMESIQEWAKDIQDSTFNIEISGEDFSCGAAFELSSGNNKDSNDNGVPDKAEATVSLELTSDDYSVLKSGGEDHYVVTVSARGADGSIVLEDSFTEVELVLVSGENSVDILGNSYLQLTGGVATFVLESVEPGDFSLRAEPFNRDDLSNSNSLSGSVTNKFVKVSSYVTEESLAEGLDVLGTNVDVFDASGGLLATLNPVSGELTLREDAEAVIYEATAEVPTRVGIESAGVTFGVFYLIEESMDDVLVTKVAEGAEAVLVHEAEGEFMELSLDEVVIGAVTELGQIAVSDGYRLEFENPGDVNIYEPIQILNSRGELVFTVTFEHPFDSATLLEAEAEYESYTRVSYFWPKGERGVLVEGIERDFAGGFAPSASAATVASTVPDTDSDLLDDLEELSIGTDLQNPDTDGDGFADGTEVFAGYSPLRGGGAGFYTDMNASHEAYHDVATLALRGVLRGYSDGSFRPENPILREEFMQVDLGAICVVCQDFTEDYKSELLDEYYQAPFPDTDINSELLACVAEGKVEGIISGYEGGEDFGFFVPKQYISRAEATKVLVETAEYSVSPPLPGEPWYMGYVRAAQEHNLIPEGDFKLDEPITRAEFAQMAVNLLQENDCRSLDADTDEGGVSDLDEILRGTNPEDASDDFPEVVLPEEPLAEVEDFTDLLRFEHEPGLYGVGDDLAYESIETAGGETESTKIYTDLVAADGISTLLVRAEIRDDENNIYADDNSSIVEFVLSDSNHAVLDSERVQVRGGQAETTLTSTENAGDVTLEAHLTDGSLPSYDSLVKVYAGEPVSVRISADSTILPAGAESVMDMRIEYFDSFGNLANYGFHTITLESTGGIELLDVRDEDASVDGMQISGPDGYLNFRVLASPNVETASVSASLLDHPESKVSWNIEHVDQMQVRLSATESKLFAGSNNGEDILVRVTNALGQTLTGFQGDVNLSWSDPKYGTVDSALLNLVAGEGSVHVSPGTLAGLASVIGESAGLTSGSVTVEIEPADPYELRLRKEDGTFALEFGNPEELIVEVFDVYGNFIDNDSSTVVDLRITDSTQDFATLSTAQVTLQQGAQDFSLNPEPTSGKVRVVAESEGLLAGTWAGDIFYKMNGRDFENIQPQILYGSLLGGPFGDVSQIDYVGGWMTFNGKTQALSSLIAEPNPKQRLATVDSFGAIEIPENSLIVQNVMAAGAKLPVRLQWRSVVDDTLQAELFYKVPDEAEQVSVDLLSSDIDLRLEAKDGGVVLRDDEAVVLDVRADGQVEVLDPLYYLEVDTTAETLSFLVFRATQPVASIRVHADFDEDVMQVESDFDLETWETLDAGIYVRPTSATVRNFEAIPSGNSSENPMGLALIDPNADLPENQKPSLSYTSLESAEEDGSVGWENENKHLLSFAAGNTAGEANLFYASEVGVLLGDPTVKIPGDFELNELGYDEGIGTQVYASQEEILELVPSDYNGDGKMDVLVAYEDGRVDLLQNYDAARRLQSRGALLSIENGIRSIDAGEFTGDDLEDLLIATEEPCREGENCLYLFENIGGGYISQYLDLEGLEAFPKQIEVADLNDDGLDDFVLFDEKSMVLIGWNENGGFSELEALDQNGFGLEAAPRQNLYSDVVLHYDNLQKGSLSLPVNSEEFIAPPNVDSDLDGFLADLLSEDDYNVLIDGVSAEGGTVLTKNNLPFEYGNTPSIAENFEIVKTLADENGGTVEMGDELSYTITVKNISGQVQSEIYVSDFLGDYFRFKKDSLVCSGCSDNASRSSSNSLSRPFIFGPTDLRNGSSFTVTYKATVNQIPNMNIMLGQDFYEDYNNDDLLDIALSPVGNSTGTLLVYYSDGFESGPQLLGGLRKVDYTKKEYSPLDAEYEEEYESSEVDDPLKDSNADGIPDLFEVEEDGELVPFDPNVGIRVPLPGQKDLMADLVGAIDKDGDGFYQTDEYYKNTGDSDGDGLKDTVDSWNAGDEPEDLLLDPEISFENGTLSLDLGVEVLNESVKGVVEDIEEVVSKFTCNGGCIPFPSNIAFLTPGFFHDPFFGIPTSFDPGTPLFGLLPYPPTVFCVAQGCYASQVMRFYLSPTTTLGLALAVCFGPYGAGQCYAFSVPVLDFIGFCDALNGFVADAFSKATSFSGELDAKIFSVSAEGSQGSVNGFDSSIFEGYKPPVAVNTNIQIPGFPSIFTEWWKKQKMEFFNLLDLPDVTFIIPDPQSLTNEWQGVGDEELELDPAVKLKTNIFELEKVLNTVHSIPFVDVQPEKVYFRYPALTPEEIELIKKDFTDWIEDVKELKNIVKKQYDELAEEYPDLKEDLEDVRDELIDALDQIIEGMENNLAVIEDYAHIPEQIFAIRDLEAYYAKVVICYLDAFLTYFGGYVKENSQRIEAWAQLVEDLKALVIDWQALINLSINLMDSCDKCTNQRYSAFQILASLFVFVPEPPIIELPQWPDIVIDVSEVQAGVDIIWPEVVFVPEPINVPELPRIEIPVLPIELALDFSLADIVIPVLPAYNLLIDLPELPGLPLPDLPDIPPPPALPDLDLNIEATLDIVSSILRVICAIRQGFIPVPELALKTKVEEITERSGVWPFDLNITVEFPPIDFDFLERIEIKTYLKVSPELDVLFELIDGLADASNDYVQDTISEFNEALKEAVESVDEAIDIEAPEGIDTEVDADLGANLDPATQLANSLKDHPLIQSKLSSFEDQWTALAEASAAWNEATPDEYRITATQRFLALDDPLLNRYDEIANNPDLDMELLAQIKGTPLDGLAQMRNSMIAYVDDLESGTQRLEHLDGESFHRYLAQESERFTETTILASDEDESISTAELLDLEDISSEAYDAPVILSQTEANSGVIVSTAESINDGIYIVDENVALRLVAYNAESKENIRTVFLDVDSDGDEDILYSLTGDVYLKENYSRNANLDYVSAAPKVLSVDELTPNYGSVKNLKNGKNEQEEASFAFDTASGANGYEILLYDSLDAQDADPDENIKRIVLYEDVENEAEAADGPIVRTSRLWVDSVSGNVKLLGGLKRTEIFSDSEIESGDELKFQTLEDSRFEIKSGGESTPIDVPANSVVIFERQGDRVLRLESGHAWWIQSETLEEQDLEEGMEIFAGEQVTLESRSAAATLLDSDGATFELDNEELFVMDKLLNTENPSAQVALENGAYYSVMRSIFPAESGTISDNVLLNPQICADQSAPYPILSDQEIDLAVFSATEISAESSFDSDSEIVDTTWDLDNSIDVDGDGILNNDEEVIGLTAMIGPYDTLSTKIVTVWVTDTAGNKASATVTVHIVVPEMLLSEAHPTEVLGTTENPESPLFPFNLIRERDGTIAEVGDGYYTDENGDIVVTGLEAAELINVYDAAHELIAQFNPKTKQLVVYDNRYEALALPAAGEWPARLVVADIGTGLILGSFIIVSDETEAVSILQNPLENLDLSAQDNATVYVAADEENYELVDDGFVALNEDGVVEFKLGTNGNVLLLDDRFTILKRPADSLEEFLVIELYDDGVLELEIYPGSGENYTLTNTEELGLPPSQPVAGTHEDISGDFRLYFEDIGAEDPLADEIGELVERGVLEGYSIDGDQYFLPDQPITRAEFGKIILGILCIIPREEAYLLPNVFNDVLNPSEWFYPSSKEGFLQDFITGYLGETDAAGLAPFKPGQTINRAEASKIMLEALEEEGVIDLPDDLFGEPWYVPYIEIAQDFSEYMVTETSAGTVNYILTAEEAADPAHIVTRYEFVEMSTRALQAYNCFELDSDGDTLPNFEEESTHGTDPYNPDTDSGGVGDGVEVGRGSDPLDPSDDFSTDTGLGLDPGIYAVSEPCISCPCPAVLDVSGDLQVGDTVYAIVQNAAGETLGKSNELLVTESP